MNHAPALGVPAQAVQNRLTLVTPVVPHAPEYYAPDAEHVVKPAAARTAVVTVAMIPTALVKNAPTAMSVSYAATVNVKTAKAEYPDVREESARDVANAQCAVNAAAVTIRTEPDVPVSSVRYATSVIYAGTVNVTIATFAVV